VIAASLDAPYTLRHIEEMLGLGRGVVAGLINAGFVVPARGPRNEYRFTFQDVVLLRTAHHLKTAKIPARRLLRSLRELRSKLPAEMPLAGLRIRAIGSDVAVRNADAQWEDGSGQLLMDFEVATSQGSVSFMQRTPVVDETPPPARGGDHWFSRGEQLEAVDAPAAEAAYREALRAAPDHLEAAVNLIAMLCDSGRAGEALALCDQALAQHADEPLLDFNRAVALEDLHRDRDAAQGYERCLQRAPDFADAHYNLARLREKLGEPQAALRHYNAYRRLQPQ
jgi:tetratricopeptide (TPR) repeat protein